MDFPVWWHFFYISQLKFWRNLWWAERKSGWVSLELHIPRQYEQYGSNGKIGLRKFVRIVRFLHICIVRQFWAQFWDFEILCHQDTLTTSLKLVFFAISKCKLTFTRPWTTIVGIICMDGHVSSKLNLIFSSPNLKTSTSARLMYPVLARAMYLV